MTLTAAEICLLAEQAEMDPAGTAAMVVQLYGPTSDAVRVMAHLGLWLDTDIARFESAAAPRKIILTNQEYFWFGPARFAEQYPNETYITPQRLKMLGVAVWRELKARMVEQRN